MARPASSHPGFEWILKNFDRLLEEHPDHWVIADESGFVLADADAQRILDRLTLDNHFAVVFLDSRLGRSTPTGTFNPPPLTNFGGGGVTFDDAQEVLRAR